jgi:hypothetical protein
MTLILLICGVLFLSYLKARCERKEAETKLLMEKWKTAREKRKLWRIRNPWSRVDHEDYEELWRIEIGAEDLYLLSINGQGHAMSYNDYNHERRSLDESGTNWSD